ncbi:glycoside hydrolase family 2 protein [Lophiostoma macrostomum CBS 122681]|uniref:Glycoside hydrolase family 2 protein n=1 Tax=Lophiostoma macrostomum CBS 122681 TaxID=1314788 RepID=A0A6A6SZU8_9PLEO|nr:glycoside hydrolase family 2 protein [Lophiostoma macrostomum CBS 122681]
MYYLAIVVIISSALIFCPTLAIATDDTTVIPSWKVQSTSLVGSNTSDLSSLGLDTTNWHTIGSRATLLATLLENGDYTDSDLFYSTNLQKVDYSQFTVPWYYRSEIHISSANASYFTLKTHDITSRADIYLNAALIANSSVQAGAYAGRDYDVTKYVREGSNVLLLEVYPTDYNRDFALGFVDWNPSPPDNGTGIWRDVEIKRTGPVSLSSPRIVTALKGEISIRLDVRNLAENPVQGQISCTITDPQGEEVDTPSTSYAVNGTGSTKVSLNTQIQNPQIWWPKAWGAQPLYSISCSASSSTSGPSTTSDHTPPVRFGIRTITRTLNAHNDTLFTINNHAFQVLGAGYTPDIFLRFSHTKALAQMQYTLSMGLNTLRLEGKLEHPSFYALADSLGLMILPGWECCDKWEAWTYNDEGSGLAWSDADYDIAKLSMQHGARMMQSHPSVLGFLVGSDFWPDEKATQIYTTALRDADWDTPIIASASQRGFPDALGNGGMKMDGPYDYVPPVYWYAAPSFPDSNVSHLGAAFGFGSELGAGVGTPELGSLRKFLNDRDLADLWQRPEMGLYHMSTNVSSFYTRQIYDDALWERYGAPKDLDDYVRKCQIADYEAAKVQFEAYASRWGTEGVERNKRTATGAVYWMLNNAWPSLHWNLFDFYLRPAGAYFGVKSALGSAEQVVFDYSDGSLWLVNRGLHGTGLRVVEVEMRGLNGTLLLQRKIATATKPNSSQRIGLVQGNSSTDEIGIGLIEKGDVALLRILLHSSENSTETIARNVYWLSGEQDALDWENSDWYHTPLTSYADFSALDRLQEVDVSVTVETSGSQGRAKVVLINKSQTPAVAVKLNFVDRKGDDVVPILWQDNYVVLWPEEKTNIDVQVEGTWEGVQLEVEGLNVQRRVVDVVKF